MSRPTKAAKAAVLNLAALRKATADMHAEHFAAMLKRAGLPCPVREHRFHPDRMWRFDYAWPAEKIALEVEGGVWTNGRHTRGVGFVADMDKYSEAAVMGWCVIRTTPARLASRTNEERIRRAMKRAEGR